MPWHFVECPLEITIFTFGFPYSGSSDGGGRVGERCGFFTLDNPGMLAHVRIEPRGAVTPASALTTNREGTSIMADFPVTRILTAVAITTALCTASAMAGECRADQPTEQWRCFRLSEPAAQAPAPEKVPPATQARRIEPGISFSMNYGHLLGCTDLLDAADAKWTEQTGVRMHRTERPASSPAPDCTYLLPGVQFKVVKVDDTLMGMSPAFRKLCLRPITQKETEACRWAIVFLP
jgi:hypothetical protein